MKKMRKVAALLLALVMAMSMTMNVFAAEANLTGHTYKAYQIFVGTQTTDADDVYLYEVDWGTGIYGTAFLEALKASTDFSDAVDFSDCEKAYDVAEILGKINEDTADTADENNKE